MGGTINLSFSGLVKNRAVIFTLDVTIGVSGVATIAWPANLYNVPAGLPTTLGSRYILYISGFRDSSGTERYQVVNNLAGTGGTVPWSGVTPMDVDKDFAGHSIFNLIGVWVNGSRTKGFTNIPSVSLQYSCPTPQIHDFQIPIGTSIFQIKPTEVDSLVDLMMNNFKIKKINDLEFNSTGNPQMIQTSGDGKVFDFTVDGMDSMHLSRELVHTGGVLELFTNVSDAASFSSYKAVNKYASPVANLLIGRYTFDALDASSTQQSYGQISGNIANPALADLAGTINFQVWDNQIHGSPFVANILSVVGDVAVGVGTDFHAFQLYHTGNILPDIGSGNPSIYALGDNSHIFLGLFSSQFHLFGPANSDYTYSAAGWNSSFAPYFDNTWNLGTLSGFGGAKFRWASAYFTAGIHLYDGSSSLEGYIIKDVGSHDLIYNFNDGTSGALNGHVFQITGSEVIRFNSLGVKVSYNFISDVTPALVGGVPFYLLGNSTNFWLSAFVGKYYVGDTSHFVDLSGSDLRFNSSSTHAFVFATGATSFATMTSTLFQPVTNNSFSLGDNSHAIKSLDVYTMNIHGLAAFVGTVGGGITGWASDVFPSVDGGQNLGSISPLARWLHHYMNGNFYNYETGSSNKYLQIWKDTTVHDVIYNLNDTITAIGHQFVKNGSTNLAYIGDDGIFFEVVDHPSIRRVTTGTYTLDNIYSVYFCDTTSGNITLNLPPVSVTYQGQQYRIIKTAAANSVIINRAGSDTINGATSVTLTSQYDHRELISDAGTFWGVF